jgi:type IV secretion system protein TrbI
VVLALEVGLQSPKAQGAQTQAESTSSTPSPAESVNALPNHYGPPGPQAQGVDQDSREASAAVPPLGPPALADFSAGADASHLTPLEQYAQQRALERARSEDQARSAGVAFTGGNGASASPVNTVSTVAMDPAAGLSNHLLDAAGRALPGASTSSSRDDANRQDDKNSFADKDRSTDFDLHHGLQYPRSPFTLFAGTIIPCVMTQGINSDLPGQIGCMVSQNVYDTVTGESLLLPQGTKAIGTYDSRISYGQDRVLIVWTRLLRPDGSAISLEGMPGTDLSGYAGLTGHVNNHYARLLAGVVLGSVIGARAQIAAGANGQNPSIGQLATQGVGQNINQAGQEITRRNLNVQPTIEVAPGSRLNVFATKDLILPPYNR